MTEPINSSKKLQATDVAGYSDTLALIVFEHDARIAHEQREVIKVLVERLRIALHGQPCKCEVCKGDKAALAAAAPYIQD